MGGKTSKEKPEPVLKPEKQQSTKHVRLLVLHKNSEQPQPGTGNFCDVLNTNMVSVDHSDVKISEIPDDGQFPEPVKNEITTWISEWLNQGRIVLICLLSDYDLTPFNIEDDRIIVCRFRNPPVNFPFICIDEDFYTATPRSIKEKGGEVFDAILAAGHQ